MIESSKTRFRLEIWRQRVANFLRKDILDNKKVFSFSEIFFVLDTDLLSGTSVKKISAMFCSALIAARDNF